MTSDYTATSGACYECTSEVGVLELVSHESYCNQIEGCCTKTAISDLFYLDENNYCTINYLTQSGTSEIDIEEFTSQILFAGDIFAGILFQHWFILKGKKSEFLEDEKYLLSINCDFNPIMMKRNSDLLTRNSKERENRCWIKNIEIKSAF